MKNILTIKKKRILNSLKWGLCLNQMVEEPLQDSTTQRCQMISILACKTPAILALGPSSHSFLL